MREILFRGKREEDGKWVYGSFVPDATELRGLTVEMPGFIRNYDFKHESGCKVLMHEVDRKTVGQFTGLLDKNGKKIFEGDMLKPFDDEIDKMVVEVHHGAFMLCLYGERGYMGEGGWVEEGNYGVFECEPLSSYGDDIEVIGNVHDTPELLKGE